MEPVAKAPAAYHLLRASNGECYFELRNKGVPLVSSPRFLRTGSALLGIRACRFFSQLASSYRRDELRSHARRPFSFELWSEHGSILVSAPSYHTEATREQAIVRFRQCALSETIEITHVDASAVVPDSVDASLQLKAKASSWL